MGRGTFEDGRKVTKRRGSSGLFFGAFVNVLRRGQRESSAGKGSNEVRDRDGSDVQLRKSRSYQSWK